MPCQNERVAYVMGKLMAVQRQRDALDKVLQTAPGLDLSRDHSTELVEFLQQRQTDSDPIVRLLNMSVNSMTGRLDVFREPLAIDVMKEYPLDSPLMLNAARDHGVDTRILREINEQE